MCVQCRVTFLSATVESYRFTNFKSWLNEALGNEINNGLLKLPLPFPGVGMLAAKLSLSPTA